MVSVALCTYNGEAFIEKQLASITLQSIPVDEIIVCDDCSTDGTIDIITDFKEKYPNANIQLFVNENNIGVTKNFEHALRLCKGDIIFLSDQDDIWHQRKVEKTLKVINNDSKCLLVFTDAYLVDSDGNDLGTGLWELTNPSLKNSYNTMDFTGARYVTGATVAIRKELLEKTLPIPECWIHDAWFAINASVYGEVKFVDEKLIYYRQHGNNVIGAKKRSIIEQIRYTKENIHKSIKHRAIMQERYSTLLDSIGDQITNEEKTDLIKCIGFWRDSTQISHSSKRKGLLAINKNLANGYYHKYNNGIYGAMVDFYILMKKPSINVGEGKA